jgi:hypothetical protein
VRRAGRLSGSLAFKDDLSANSACPQAAGIRLKRSTPSLRSMNNARELRPPSPCLTLKEMLDLEILVEITVELKFKQPPPFLRRESDPCMLILSASTTAEGIVRLRVTSSFV